MVEKPVWKQILKEKSSGRKKMIADSYLESRKERRTMKIENVDQI